MKNVKVRVCFYILVDYQVFILLQDRIEHWGEREKSGQAPLLSKRIWTPAPAPDSFNGRAANTDTKRKTICCARTENSSWQKDGLVS